MRADMPHISRLPRAPLGGECALSRITCRHRFLDRQSMSESSLWSASSANGGNSSALLVTCTVWQAVQRLDRREMNEQPQTGTFVYHSEGPQTGYPHFARAWAHQQVQPQMPPLLPP